MRRQRRLGRFQGGALHEEGDVVAGRYEIFSDEPAGFRFRLKASNGDVAVTSENYKTKKSLLEGLGSFRRNAASEKVDDLTLES